MINDQTMRIISSILRVMTTTRAPEEIAARVSAELLESGLSPAEVTEALRLVASLMEGFPAPAAGAPSSGARELRAPHPREALKLSDDAIDLLTGWRQNRLMTPEENEMILARILEAGIGEIEPDELKRIAAEASGRESLLALYLADSATAAN